MRPPVHTPAAVRRYPDLPGWRLYREQLDDASSAAADYAAALEPDDGADADFPDELREALARCAARHPS